jgi:hypothetical protein
MSSARLTAFVVPALALTAFALPASASSPPSSWQNERNLLCDGEPVRAFLTPGGFGTPFHVVGSDEVIIPKHVEVVFPGETEAVTTLHVKGFDRNQVGTVRCTYTDPAGLFVDFEGLRV